MKVNIMQVLILESGNKIDWNLNMKLAIFRIGEDLENATFI